MLVFIDGENFRQVLTKVLVDAGYIGEKDSFRYNLAALLRDLLGTDDLQIKYYSSRVKPPRGFNPDEHILKSMDKIKESSRRWTAYLANQGIECIKAGNLKAKESNPCPNCEYQYMRLQEKGVDVRLALDMFEASLDGGVEKIAIVSSDTDLCPTYHKMSNRGVGIQYICFAPFVNRAVSAATDETITITSEKAAKYIVKNT